MKITIQCPYCPTQIKLSETATMATCPKCFQTFSAVQDDEPPLADIVGMLAEKGSAKGSTKARKVGSTQERIAEVEETEPEEVSSTPAWINAWGAAAFIVTTLGLLEASVIGIRWITIACAATGFVLVIAGISASAKDRQQKDLVWLTLSGTLSVTALLLVVFAPGMLNYYWTMDAAVPLPDPNKLVVVPRGEPRSAGKPQLGDVWAAAEKEAVREDDVLLRLDSVAIGKIPERGAGDFLLIHLRIASAGNERKIHFNGFSTAKNQPILKDVAGRSYRFLEQRPRKLKAGPPHVFISESPEPRDIGPGRYLDYQLVFEPPPADFSNLNLELPASAWGRKGAAKFRIPGTFALYVQQ